MKLSVFVSLFIVGMALCKCVQSHRRHRREAVASADANPGGALWASASAVGCESCGRECASACGTRHFRTCCFNYLRRKRTPLATVPPSGLKFQLWLAKNSQDLEYRHDKRLPIFIENTPEEAASAYSPNDVEEDPLESRLQLIYDA